MALNYLVTANKGTDRDMFNLYADYPDCDLFQMGNILYNLRPNAGGSKTSSIS